MMARIRNEPVLVTAFVGAALALAVAFGLELSEEQTASVIGVVTAALALFARSKVTPVAEHTPEHREIP